VSEQPLIQRFHLGDLDYIRSILVEIYIECYAPGRKEKFFTREGFRGRLADHAGPGWEAVVSYHQGVPSGYAYGCPLPSDTAWWDGVEPTPPPNVIDESGRRTFALLQLMVREDWRGTGTARLLHDDLLKHRSEERIALLVDREHPKVRSLYERWGYTPLTQSHPYPDGPLYDVMLRSNNYRNSNYRMTSPRRRQLGPRR